jgi:hypothetical protein
MKGPVPYEDYVPKKEWAKMDKELYMACSERAFKSKDPVYYMEILTELYAIDFPISNEDFIKNTLK